MKETHIIRLRQVTSTNDHAAALLAKGPLPDRTIIVAESQTMGRGVDGNAWESEKGKNLTFSLVIYPDYVLPEQQFYLTKAISLGVYRFAKEYLGGETSVKWPNDIYYSQKKLAGILIQNGIQGARISYCIAGIGLNVNQLEFSEDIPNPVSLKNITNKDYDLDGLLDEVLHSISGYLDLLKEGHFQEMDREYLSVLFRYNEMADYIHKGTQIKATIKGIDPFGHLVLEVPGKESIVCDLKEIEFVI